MLYQKEKQIAIAAVTAAAKLCQQVRQAGFDSFSKSDRTPVTLADLGSQAIVCQFLSDAFPNEPIIAEEDAQMLQQPENLELLKQITGYVQTAIPHATPEEIIAWIDRGNGKIASRYWTLDPIDGTKGFIRGDQYAIALALVEQGQVQVGVLGCPALPLNRSEGVLFVAVKDQGTAMMSLDGSNFHPLQVNQYSDPDRVQLVESVESAHSDRPRLGAVVKKLGLTRPSVQMDSQAKYGAVARGEADIYVRIPLPQDSCRRENIWDHAAGAIVVCEAGGRVTDLDGNPLDFSLGSKLEQNRGIIASNGAIHDQVLEAITACAN